MRGQHVHEDDYVPRDIKRIGLLELLSGGVGKRPTKFQKLYTPLIGSAVRDARRTWVKNCTSAKKTIENIAKISFKETKSIWSHLKREIEVRPDQ